jgi:hypothetical protein
LVAQRSGRYRFYLAQEANSEEKYNSFRVIIKSEDKHKDMVKRGAWTTGKRYTDINCGFLEAGSEYTVQVEIDNFDPKVP